MQHSDAAEYGDAMVAALELIWGEGFLSPGGPEEVAAALAGRDIRGAEVLDIGCGIGGIDLLLAERFCAAKVTGIDVEGDNIERARRRAERRGLAGRVGYRLVEPGPLPFEPASFDVVFMSLRSTEGRSGRPGPSAGRGRLANYQMISPVPREALSRSSRVLA